MRAHYQAWLCLGAAIVFELTGTLSMKLAGGFTQLWPSLLVFVCYGLAIALLSLALKGIELGIAYAVWSGVGTLLVTAAGIYAFQESASLAKLACIALIVAGVAGLKLADPGAPG